MDDPLKLISIIENFQQTNGSWWTIKKVGLCRIAKTMKKDS